MVKLGNIGIGDLPKLSKEEKGNVNLPLMQELCESVKSTDYYNVENRANNLVTELFSKGGDVYFHKEAISKYGGEQVQTALKYYREFSISPTLSMEDKMAVCGWIADNIFDMDVMEVNNG